MRTPRILALALIPALAAGCGADPEPDALAPISIDVGTTPLTEVRIAGLSADLEILTGPASTLQVWSAAGAQALPVAVENGVLRLDACDGCAQLVRLTVPAEADVQVVDHRGLVDVFDLDGPLHLEVVEGDACLTGVAGPTDVSVADGDLIGRGLWTPQLSADVSGAVDAVWTRPPSDLSLEAGGDVTGVFATYFYSVTVEADGAVDLGHLVPVPESPHHLQIEAGGDVALDFGPAQGTAPARR